MISPYLVLGIYAMSIDLFSIFYLCLRKVLRSILILLWMIVNIVFLQDRERRRWQQAARQQHSKIVSQHCLSKCIYQSLAQMYIPVCICLFYTGFNLCQACAIISNLFLLFHHANLEGTFMLLSFIVAFLSSFLTFRMQFPMRFLRGSGVHGAKLLFQDLGFYFNLSFYKTTIQAYLNFF